MIHSVIAQYPRVLDLPHASLDQMTKRVGRSVPGTYNGCEWVSNIEQERSPSGDRNFGNLLEYTHLSLGESPPKAEKHLETHETYCLGAPKFELANNLAGVVDELTRTAAERFHLADTSLSRKRSTDACSEKGHKRPKLGSCQDPASAGSVSDSTESDTVPVEHRIERVPQVWPCPFFVRDRVSHLNCLTRHCLLSMDDVREHLCSEHLESIYCSVCYETFPTVRLRDEHMRNQQCSYRLPVIFDGLRDSQVRELQRQGSVADWVPGLQSSQWIKIWSVVFSCTPPPPSPFSFSQQELRVYQFRRFWDKNGGNIIADVLAKHRLQQYNVEGEERKVDALHLLVANRAVDSMLLT